MRFRRSVFCFAAALVLAVSSCALAYKADTLRSGSRGDEVQELQAALIKLGYLGGTPDGIFGRNTENAVRKFQKASGLKADGLAGTQTRELLSKKAGKVSGTKTAAADTQKTAASETKKAEQAETKKASSQSSTAVSQNLFGGNYTTIRMGYTGSRVSALQKALISLGYLKGSADGKFGKMTQAAVISFQKASRLTADGLAGRMTLTALESSLSSGSKAAAEPEPAPAASAAKSGDPSSGRTASGPSGNQVKLLHWYNDVKPTLKNGQTLAIYDPSSGQSWNLRIVSSGRHCDAEPRTAGDTANMLKAFGGENTWSQKAVYVKLPNGSWTIGATHSMPHLNGSIKDNNFDGHLCVHFLRTMSEAQENDPSYGVANQNTIRSFWKSLTGETIAE